MTRAPRLTVVDAVAEIISGLSPAIVPTTTLSAQSNAGTNQVTLSSSSVAALAARSAPGGVLSFFDSTGEKPVKIKSVSGSVLTLDFTGRGWIALQQTHLVGATVALNIIGGAPPIDPSHNLQNGYPYVAADTLGGKTRWSANRQTTAAEGV